MTVIQTFVISMVLSLPLVGLMAMGRAVFCVFRCREARKVASFVLPCVSVLIMAGVLAFDVVVLFGYGVAHTGKDAATDMLVLAITVIPTYGVAFGIWWGCRYLERRLTGTNR